MSVHLELVKADLDAREALGLKKYGTTMDRQDLSLVDWLQHAYEETLDKALYLKKAILTLREDAVQKAEALAPGETFGRSSSLEAGYVEEDARHE